MAGVIVAVIVSKARGERQTPAAQVPLRENPGVVGDAHAGDWHSQVSLLATESIAKMQACCRSALATLPRKSPHRG